jgi:hypothetical protein
MPPRYLRKGSTKLKPCSEFTVEACDIAPADQCCGALPCKLCLELDVYGEPTAYGTATFGGSSWTGTVGGLAFVSYWEKNYEGECEYVVTLDGEEVYRATCYEGASCRDPGGSVGVTIGYDEGTLTWAKHEPRPLALTTDPDTGCNDFFCGTCRCSCRTLCVDVFENLFSYGTQYAVDTYSGTLTDTAYSDCDPPVWEGTIGNFEIRLALGRDSYGNCIVTATANGEESIVSVTGCEDLSGTVELYDGSYFNFRCNDCNNCATVVGDCICGRSLGPTLRVVWASGNGTHGDAPREFLMHYGMQNEPTITCAPFTASSTSFPGWRGIVSGGFPMPQGGVHSNALEVIIPCGCIAPAEGLYYRWLEGERPDFWVQSAYSIISCDCPAILDGNGMSQYDLWGHQVSNVLIYELESNC